MPGEGQGGRWGMLLPLACVLLMGGHTVISKMAAGVISPEAISFYRWVVAMVVLTPMLAGEFMREWPQIRGHLGRLAILSFLGMVAYQALVYVAAKNTTATNIAIIGALVPLVSVAWAALLLKYRPGPLVLAGCAVSLAGVIVLVQRGDPFAIFSTRPAISDLYVLLGVACYGLYGVLLRRWQLPISVRPMFFAQAVLALLITAPGPLIGTATPITWANGAIVLIAGLAGSVIIPFLWMKSVQTVGPVATGIFTNLTPLITAAIAVSYLGETVEPFHIAGATLIIGGVLLAQFATSRESALLTAR